MSYAFSTNSGSFESLNVSVRCGLRSNARQILPIVEAESPDLLSHLRERDQWVAFSGTDSSASATTTSSTCSAVTVAGLPGRGSSRACPTAVRRTAGAISRPSPPTRRTHPRIRVRSPHPHTQARSATQRQTLGRSSCAAPTAPVAHARDRSTQHPLGASSSRTSTITTHPLPRSLKAQETRCLAAPPTASGPARPAPRRRARRRCPRPRGPSRSTARARRGRPGDPRGRAQPDRRAQLVGPRADVLHGQLAERSVGAADEHRPPDDLIALGIGLAHPPPPYPPSARRRAATTAWP